ncbi:GNAT superfamily N-acetyltransferase [Rhodococcus sp. 27YEA15]
MVVRYKLPPGYTHPVTDVIGVLESLDPIAVRGNDGRLIQVSVGQVVAMKTIGARPIRIGEIRNLESAAAQAWPGVDQEWIDGWYLRAGHGISSRANSALPLGGPGAVAGTGADVLDAIRQWYADRGLRTVLALPDRLATVPPGWVTERETVVMAADLENLTLPIGPPTATVAPSPDPRWLAMYGADAGGHVESVLRAGAGDLGFGRIGNDQTSLAIGRAAVTVSPDSRHWVGLSAIAVAAEHRRRGIGSLIGGDLLAWGRLHGATHAYVQVIDDNDGARALWRELGFVEHHRYRYATDPVGG